MVVPHRLPGVLGLVSGTHLIVRGWTPGGPGVWGLWPPQLEAPTAAFSACRTGLRPLVSPHTLWAAVQAPEGENLIGPGK